MSDDSSSNGYRGNRVQTRLNTSLPPGQSIGNRADISSLLDPTDTHSSRLWDAVHYPTESQLNDFNWHRIRYERQGEARGLIDKITADTWGTGEIEVRDDDESTREENEQTEFEQEVERFLSGETLRRKPVNRMLTADRLGTLGQFSLIFFGFDDGRSPKTPIEDGELDGLDDLNFIATYDQGRVEDYEIVDDITDERHGLPETYDVQVSEDTTETIHHSRVVHVNQGATITGDDFLGEFFFKSIAHPLVNIDKILAGAAEGYWRGSYMGIVARPPTDANGNLLRFEDGDGAGSEALQEKIDDWETNFNRMIATTGEIETLDANIASPADQLAAQFQSIAAGKDIPQSIITGNERGDMATSEDRKMYHDKQAGRREKFSEPVILRPVIQRLIDVGVFPDPVGDTFLSDWPPFAELSELEKADLFKTRAEAVNKLTAGRPNTIATWAEYRNKWFDGWNAARGSEEPADYSPADALLDGDLDEQMQAAVDAADPAMNLDEDDPQVQAQLARRQAATDGGSSE